MTALRRALRVAGAACLLGSCPAGAAPVDYRIDTDSSAVHFEVVHFGTSTLRGRFTGIVGDATLDLVARSGRVGLRVPTARVSTGVPVLDARLRQDDLFDSAGHPEAFFVSERFVFEGDRLAAVHGEFTLRGTSLPLTLRAIRFGCRADGAVSSCAGDFEGELLRSEFGLSFGLPFVGDRVRLRVQVRAERR